jgi:hypothetical protein
VLFRSPAAAPADIGRHWDCYYASLAAYGGGAGTWGGAQGGQAPK